MKRFIKAFLPDFIIRRARRLVMLLQRRRNAKRPPREIFSEIYLNNLWGGTAGTFCSGSGSLSQQTVSYVNFIIDFLNKKSIQTVVDLGCGDFEVARQFLNRDCDYIGIDIVSDLISRNQREFANNRVTFRCLDIIEDELPAGDLCLIRQVFQHLSNQQIMRILPKLAQYRYVIVTEHFPAPSARVVFNKEKMAGADIRVYDDSAVALELPPFNISGLQLVLEVEVLRPLVAPGETLKTFLLEQSAKTAPLSG
jgi:SAM-dependent methyltransferase